MSRLLLLITVAAAVAIASVPAAAATAVQLRDHLAVAGETITLGDLFTDAGQAAEVAVARAPAPGKRVLLNATGVASLARRHGLVWHAAGARTIAVRRDGRTVPQEDVLAGLRKALAERSDGADIELRLTGRIPILQVARDQDATVEVEDFRFDRDRMRFQAVLAFPADAADPRRARITGRVIEVVEVPVLARPLAGDAIIRRRDIDYRRVAARQVGRDTVTDAREMIGKSPRRRLRSGQPLRVRDLRVPILVSKGAAVSMVYQAGQMRLTATGRALEGGAKGDLIRVLNNRSRRTVEATVVAGGTVAVGPQGPMRVVRR